MLPSLTPCLMENLQAALSIHMKLGFIHMLQEHVLRESSAIIVPS